MMRSRRTAHLGMGAAAVILVSALAVLLAWKGNPIGKPQARLGQPAPSFELQSAEDNRFRLADLRGRITVLAFTSTRCPIAQGYNQRIRDFAGQYADDPRVELVAIYSNVPSEDLLGLRVQAMIQEPSYPLLIDEGGRVAGRYGVDRTPTFFVIDEQGLLRYHGAFDDHRDADQAQTSYLADAVSSLLDGEPVAVAWTEPAGCRIESAR